MITESFYKLTHTRGLKNMEVILTIGIHDELMITCPESVIFFLKSKNRLGVSRSPKERLDHLENELKQSFPGITVIKRLSPEKVPNGKITKWVGGLNQC